jgi:DUF4097 and DUF4098 domain-containing protein YvlB
MSRSTPLVLPAVLAAVLAAGCTVSVNDPIVLADGETSDGGLNAVNGDIDIGEGCTVRGTSQSVNGRIELMGAVVGEDLRTLNGDIDLSGGSRVEGNIVIEDVFGANEREEPLEIVLADGSTVAGDILVEHDDFAVRVYLRDGSRVLGTIDGAEVIEAP